MLADAGQRLDEAVGLLQRAVALEPDNGAFLDSLGWACFRLGRLDEAWDYMQRALASLSADYPDEERAVILQHAGDVAVALGSATRPARTTPRRCF